jgi:thioredoxin reductase
MAVDTPAKIAILGAGPIGLEAALYARYLGYDVEIFEAREAIAPPVSAARLWTAFGENSSPLAVRALSAQNPDQPLPAPESILTVGEWYERYVRPLAESDLIIDFLHFNTRVVSIGKVEISKTDCPSGEYDRGAWDFRLLVQQRDGAERIVAADVVFDCTGTPLPIPIGHGGVWAVGERSENVQQRLTYGAADVLGAGRSRYAGKSVLVVGDDWQAAATITSLAELAAQESTTRITWATRHERAARPHGPFLLDRDDPLTARRQPMETANKLALSDKITWLPETWIEAIEATPEGSLRVRVSGQQDAEHTFDEIIAATGQRSDWSFGSELQLDVCPASDAPRPFAEALQRRSSPWSTDYPALDPSILLTSEPNYYVLGSKSFGRLPGFRYSHGLRQIRDLFTIVGDRPTLNLYA